MTSYLVSGISPGSPPSRPLSTSKEAELLRTETRCCRCSPPKLPLPLRTKLGLLPKPTKALKPGDPTPRGLLVSPSPSLSTSGLLCTQHTSTSSSNSGGSIVTQCLAHGTPLPGMFFPLLFGQTLLGPQASLQVAFAQGSFADSSLQRALWSPLTHFHFLLCPQGPFYTSECVSCFPLGTVRSLRTAPMCVLIRIPSHSVRYLAHSRCLFVR